MSAGTYFKNIVSKGRQVWKRQPVVVALVLALVVFGISFVAVKAITGSLAGTQNANSDLLQNAPAASQCSVEETATGAATEDAVVDGAATQAAQKRADGAAVEGATENAAADPSAPDDASANDAAPKDKKKSKAKSGDTSSSGPSDKKGKTWVPPTYKIVHHEAVYKTVRVVICNYCGATFGSTGEFQTHKDLHGG